MSTNGVRSIANHNHIFIDLSGTPVLKEDIHLSSGHGYAAYVAVSDQFIKTLFEELCIGKATDKYVFPSGTTYDKFELDCRDRDFFNSDSFKKLCEKHKVRLTLYTNSSDADVYNKFVPHLVRKTY